MPAAPNKKPRKRPESPRLSRDAWLDAAFAAVVEGGFDGVKVLVIARTLGVTRGSFYWHFDSQGELVAALLERWQQREEAADRELQAQTSADPQADLLRLLEAALARGGADLRDMRFELALRALGRRDRQVARLLGGVDALRMAVLEGKFMRLLGDRQMASELAALLYLAVSGGIQALGRPGNTARTAEYLKHVIAEHLIRRPAQAVKG